MFGLFSLLWTTSRSLGDPVVVEILDHLGVLEKSHRRRADNKTTFALTAGDDVACSFLVPPVPVLAQPGREGFFFPRFSG